MDALHDFVVLSGARGTINQIMKPLIDDVLAVSLRYYEVLFICDELHNVIGPWNKLAHLAEHIACC
jgi:hypothetical protein